jgi:hypothetical protein
VSISVFLADSSEGYTHFCNFVAKSSGHLGPKNTPMMTSTSRVLLSWSSGKDGAWALHDLRRQPDLEVVGLLTTFNEAFDRVAMHAVRRKLVEVQAAAAGLPLVPAMPP